MGLLFDRGKKKGCSAKGKGKGKGKKKAKDPDERSKRRFSQAFYAIISKRRSQVAGMYNWLTSKKDDQLSDAFVGWMNQDVPFMTRGRWESGKLGHQILHPWQVTAEQVRRWLDLKPIDVATLDHELTTQAAKTDTDFSLPEALFAYLICGHTQLAGPQGNYRDSLLLDNKLVTHLRGYERGIEKELKIDAQFTQQREPLETRLSTALSEIQFSITSENGYGCEAVRHGYDRKQRDIPLAAQR